jgi:hypothetical protein
VIWTGLEGIAAEVDGLLRKRPYKPAKRYVPLFRSRRACPECLNDLSRLEERMGHTCLRRGAAALAVVLGLVLAAPAVAGQNVLTWTDNSTNENNFHIERKAEACTGTAVFTEIATTGFNVNTFTDTAVIEGVTYCYRVAASNPAGKSAYSNTASRAVPFSVPAAPSGLTAAGGP